MNFHRHALLILTVVSLLLVRCTFEIKPGESGDDNSHLRDPIIEDPAEANPIKFEPAIDFINAYVDYLNARFERKTEQDRVEWINEQSTVTDHFKQALDSIIAAAELKNPGRGLDGDPILDAQDYPDDGFEPEFADSVNGYLTVKGIGWESFLITMRVVQMDGQWMVDGAGIVNIPKEKRARYQK